MSQISRENPFSTRRVRPGAIPFLFDADHSAGRIIDRLRRHGWWGEITGPHGSGKSALLATLCPALEQAGLETCLIELHDGQRRLPADFRAAAKMHPPAVLIVDGYEQLGRLSRFRLKRLCRRGKLGLLVTAHGHVGLPEVFRTTVTIELVRRIVADLQADCRLLVTAEDVDARFWQHAGDVRELLFDLYDLYEARRRSVR